jgi:GT2 family glycosyltransferase
MAHAVLAIATRDRPHLVERFLVPLIGTARSRGWDVFVVDQSRDGETEHIVSGLDGVRYLRSEPGLARARNVAIRASDAAVIGFCDDDVSADAAWFDAVSRLFAEHGDAGAVCGPVVTQEGRSLPGVEGGVYRWPSHPFRLGTGANFAVRRQALAQAGVFDEELGAGARFHAAEETDLLYRIQRASWSIVYSPELTVVHHEWRSVREELRLHYRYGVGAGAQTGKHAADGDREAVRFGVAEVGHHFYWLGRSLVGLRFRTASVQLPFLAGFATGFARRRLRGPAAA